MKMGAAKTDIQIHAVYVPVYVYTYPHSYRQYVSLELQRHPLSPCLFSWYCVKWNKDRFRSGVQLSTKAFLFKRLQQRIEPARLPNENPEIRINFITKKSGNKVLVILQLSRNSQRFISLPRFDDHRTYYKCRRYIYVYCIICDTLPFFYESKIYPMIF